MIKSPQIGIVILNYNTFELTIKLLENIYNTLLYSNYQMIVVDNYSTNDSYKKLYEYKKNSSFDFVLMQSTKNGGYAYGNNIGIKYAIQHDAEYVLIINNDIIFTDARTIDVLIDVMRKNRHIGAVSPRLISLDGQDDYPIYWNRPSFFDLSIGYYFFVKGKKKQLLNANHPLYAPRGSCMLLKSIDLEQIGCLDENTFLYYEEPILAERLLKIGKICFYVGEVSVIHNHAQTISNNVKIKDMLQHIAKSYEYYLHVYRKFPSIQVSICIFVKKILFRLKNRVN